MDGRPASPSTNDDATDHTTWLTSDGTEQAVGILSRPPTRQWVGLDPHRSRVFISHAGLGEGGIKEEIARPTYWFLKEILRVDAFLDDEGDIWGQDKNQALATAAYICTHPLVILSPTFRKRKYCVKELNTFLHRLRTNPDECQVLLTLWKIPDAQGYHESVNDIVWLKHGATDNPIYFLLKTLWPKLNDVFRREYLPDHELRQHFVTYVRYQLDSARPPPNDFVLYAHDHGACLLEPVSSDDEGLVASMGASSPASESTSGKRLTGICFSFGYMDANKMWNVRMWERKDHVEGLLRNIARHGTVIGSTSMGIKRKRRGILDFGTCVVRLECQIELSYGLSEEDNLLVRKAAVALARHLKEAGANESDLEDMMIGTLWKGSLFLLLNAPQSIFEHLSSLLTSDGQGALKLDDAFTVTGFTPALFVEFHPSETSSLSDLGTNIGHLGAILCKAEDTHMLVSTSSRATGKLLSGVPCLQWESTQKSVWSSMVEVSPHEVVMRDVEAIGTDLSFIENAAANYADLVAVGPGAHPLAFNAASRGRAERVDANVLNPTTGDIMEVQNIIYERHADGRPPSRAYAVGSEIQKCTFGAVKQCTMLSFRNDPITPWEFTPGRAAVKIMSWKNIRGLQHVEDPITEAAATQYLNKNGVHEHVVGIYDVLEDDEYLLIFMPFASSGDLFGIVKQAGRLEEPMARYWFKQILSGLSHLQRLGICHRNISLEGILVDDNRRAMISNFGLCLCVPYDAAEGRVTGVSSGTMRRLILPQIPCGKPNYISPEILKSEQPFDGFAVDLWAAAVILFIMLTGHPPWEFAREEDPRYRMVVGGGLARMLQSWERELSPMATDLLQRMLQENPRNRLSLIEVQDHPWVTASDSYSGGASSGRATTQAKTV